MEFHQFLDNIGKSLGANGRKQERIDSVVTDQFRELGLFVGTGYRHDPLGAVGIQRTKDYDLNAGIAACNFSRQILYNLRPLMIGNMANDTNAQGCDIARQQRFAPEMCDLMR